MVEALHAFPNLQTLEAIRAEAHAVGELSPLATDTRTGAVAGFGVGTATHLDRATAGWWTGQAEEDLRWERTGADSTAVDVSSGPIPEIAATAIESEQAWYWTPGWQLAERQADEDFLHGRHLVTADFDAFLAELNA